MLNTSYQKGLWDGANMLLRSCAASMNHQSGETEVKITKSRKSIGLPWPRLSNLSPREGPATARTLMLVLGYFAILFVILVALRLAVEAQDMTKILRHVALCPD